MGLPEEIGTYLASESTRFALGSTSAGGLFLNAMPESPDTATAITETGGGAPDYVFGNDLPVNENARVAVTCRSTSSTRARADANAAWVAIGKIANQSLSGTSWLRAEPVQSPFLLRRDEQGRVHYQFNAACTRRTTST